jgi:hypothetical protein
MIDVRRAGPGDAGELMRLRGVMLGGMRGVAEVTGDWQRTGAETLRTRLVTAQASFAAFVADKGDRPGAGAGVIDLRASPDGEPLYASLGFVRTTDPAMRLVTRAR